MEIYPVKMKRPHIHSNINSQIVHISRSTNIQLKNRDCNTTTN